MEFKVLGHLEVVSADGPIILNNGKLQILLATLLLQVNETVPTEALIDRLWNSPAAPARATLHVHVNRLRRALGSSRGRGPVQTRPGGYALIADPEQVDLHRFRRLVELAGRVAADGPARESALLGEALALWRGPALAGVPSELLQAREAAALEEERLAALTRRIGADLALGRHRDLIPELGALVREHPLREALRRQLMLALYRAERVPEALEVYRETHGLLPGLEPGPEMRALHEAILRADPELDHDPTAAHRPLTVAVPHELPRDVPTFCGRDADLAALDAALPELPGPAHAGVVAITGEPGVGKTALAVHWARRVRDWFPDGEIFVDLRGFSAQRPMPVADALAHLLRALGVPPSAVPAGAGELAARYRALLHGRRILVVLDNAADVEQVRPLLPASPGCLAVLTSRKQLWDLMVTHDALLLPLRSISAGDGVRLVGQLLGEPRVAAEPEATAELVELCGRLPLAIRVAAVNLAGSPATTIAEHVAALRAEDRLGQLSVDGDPEAAVRAAFDHSYTRLPNGARRLFRLLGVVPVHDFSAPSAAAAAGLPLASAERLLDQLTIAHLLQNPTRGRYQFHDLLREYAKDLAAQEDSAEDRRAAARRLLDFHLRSAEAAAVLLYPHLLRLPAIGAVPGVAPAPMPEETAAVRWLDAERNNLVAAATGASQHGFPSYSWLIADALRGCFWSGPYRAEGLTICAAALSAAEAHQDPDAEATVRDLLGLIHHHLGDPDRALACFRRALALSRGSGNLAAAARALHHLGWAHLHLGEYPRAAEQFAQAVRAAEQAGHPGTLARCLDSLGVATLLRGRVEEAIFYHTEACQQGRNLGSQWIEAFALANLGLARWAHGDQDLAEQCLTQALALAERFGYSDGEVRALAPLALLDLERGRLEQATARAERATHRCVTLGDRHNEVNSRLVLAAAHRAAGRLTTAESAYQEILRLTRQTHHRGGEAAALLGLAKVHRAQGNPDQAAPQALAALDLVRTLGARLQEGRVLTELARIALAKGNRPEARGHAEKAIRLHQETGQRREEAHASEIHAQASAPPA